MTAIALPRPVTIGGPTSARFPAIGTTHRIHVTNPSCLIEATAIAREELDLLDGAVSRFRPDSEISLLATRAAHGRAWIFASATLSHYLGESLRAARLTDGLVDPTVGAAVMASGYDADLLLVQRRPALTDPGADAVVPGWRHIDLDPATRRLSVPKGCLIDLGASAKAAAADRIAQRLADRLPGGFLVNLGGDIATSGELPDNGWRIGIEAANGSILQVVTGTGRRLPPRRRRSALGRPGLAASGGITSSTPAPAAPPHRHGPRSPARQPAGLKPTRPQQRPSSSVTKRRNGCAATAYQRGWMHSTGL